MMRMIREISRAVEQYRASGLQAILIHPERCPELYRELDSVSWRRDDTGEVVEGRPLERDDFKDPDGAIVRVCGVPVFEDRYLQLPIWTPPPERKRILFYTRRLQDNGVNLIQGWTE